MLWPNLGLACLIVALLLAAGLAGRPRAWAYGRVAATISLQLAGVVAVTWLLVQAIPPAGAGGAAGAPSVPVPHTVDALVTTLAKPARNSLELVALAVCWGTAAGSIAAVLLLTGKRRRFGYLVPSTVLVWVVPTFILAVAAQWLQARAYDVTGTPVGGLYGEAGPLNIVWAAAVLGLRPAIYGFRQTHNALEQERGELHVRAAIARGLPSSVILWRSVIRPAAATLVSSWLVSFRLIIGVLPLVEFFFAYPGLGNQLILALGLTYGGGRGPVVADVAIGVVVALSFLLLTVEGLARVWRLRLDPRLQSEQAVA